MTVVALILLAAALGVLAFLLVLGPPDDPITDPEDQPLRIGTVIGGALIGTALWVAILFALLALP